MTEMVCRKANEGLRRGLREHEVAAFYRSYYFEKKIPDKIFDRYTNAQLLVCEQHTDLDFGYLVKLSNLTDFFRNSFAHSVCLVG